jgi:hypothetical protein
MVSRSFFDLVARGQLIGLACRGLISEAGDDAQVVESLVGLRLKFGLTEIRANRGRAGLLSHQVALQLDLGVVVVALGGLQRQAGVHRLLLQLRIGKVHDDRVGFDVRSGQHQNARHRGLGFGGDQTELILARHQRTS